MKRAKIMIAVIGILAVLGISFAVKARTYSQNYIYTGPILQKDGVSACTTLTIGSAVTGGTPNVIASTTSRTSGSGPERTIAVTGNDNVVTFNAIVDTTKIRFTYNGVSVSYGIIISPITGRKWMDRNLGASRVATASNDAQAYGDMFQWGRGADRHQRRTSRTTFTLSTTDVPGHSNFILNPSSNNWYDWRNPQNNNLWQGSSSVNNPCPCGWHVPTRDEWAAEISGITDATTAFNSHLKLTVCGEQRTPEGVISHAGTVGSYWSSSIAGYNAWYFYFPYNIAGSLSTFPRSNGLAVRCIKDL